MKRTMKRFFCVLMGLIFVLLNVDGTIIAEARNETRSLLSADLAVVDAISNVRTLTVSPTSVGFVAAAGNRTINVTSNGVWNQPTSNVSWLTISNVTPTNRRGNGSFRINVTTNIGAASRSGTITIRRNDGAVSRTISVTQVGRTLTVSPTSVSFGSAAGNRTINVTSNGAWTQPTSNVSWLSISNVTPANRNGNGSFRMNATANMGAASRSGTITIRRNDGAVSRTISVTQVGRTLTVSPTSVSFGVGAGNRVINVTSNGVWNQPTSNVNWLTISNVAPANRNGNGSFRINAAANTSTVSRSGTITVRRNDGSIARTIAVTQVGRTLAVSPTSVNFGVGAANRVVNVTSNGVWNQPTSNVNWLTISNVAPANRNGNGSFRINATANTSTVSRSGTITVRRNDGSIARTISVTQAGRTLAVSPTSVNFGVGAANRVVNVTSNGVWNQPTSNVNWLTISNVAPANRNGNGSFRINATANASAVARSGTITVRRNDGSITRTITVTQAGRTLTASPATINFTEGDAEHRTITVTSNTSWNQPTSNVNWLTISNVAPANRTGNGSFRINVAANTGATARSGRITVVSGGVSRDVTITQPARVTLTFNPNGGIVSPTTRSVVRGGGIANGVLPIPTRGGHVFVDWFNTSLTGGGTRIRTGAVFHQNTILWARWNDPSRHLGFWWPPSASGITMIDYTIVGNPGTIWVNRIDAGATAWNASNARVGFRNRAGAPNRVVIVNHGPPGELQHWTTGSRLDRFDIRLNGDWVEEFAAQNNIPEAHVAAYLMAHEFGHAIGLDNDPALRMNETSVMTQGVIRRDSVAIITPFDVVSVNMIY